MTTISLITEFLNNENNLSILGKPSHIIASSIGQHNQDDESSLNTITIKQSSNQSIEDEKLWEIMDEIEKGIKSLFTIETVSEIFQQHKAKWTLDRYTPYTKEFSSSDHDSFTIKITDHTIYIIEFYSGQY